MAEVSPRDRASRGFSLALRRLSEMKATNVAAEMGVSDATVSKLKTEQLEQAITLLAFLGLKVTPAEFRCVDPKDFEYLTKTHLRVLTSNPGLIWDVDE